MVEEDVIQKFWLKNIDKTRSYSLEEIKQYELMSKKHKKVCTSLNYSEHFLILASTITGRISLLGIPIVITSSAIGLNIWVITGEIKKI